MLSALIKNIALLALFVVLTFILLESIKYAQTAERKSRIPSYVLMIESQAEADNGKLEDNKVLKELSAEDYFKWFYDFDVDAEQEIIEQKTTEVVPLMLDDAGLAQEDEVETENDVVQEDLEDDSSDVDEAVDEPEEKVVFDRVISKDKPLIVVVIDDMGISKKRTKDINSLKYPITTSFLTYGENLDAQIADSLKANHEVIAHIPMEAQSKVEIAPDMLKVSMSDKEIANSLRKMLAKFPDVKGVNNHMGSKFTENAAKMDVVIGELYNRRLFFLDSRTSGKSVGCDVAKKYPLPCVRRSVFIDNENTYNHVMEKLHLAEKIAKRNGYAIAIGHPKSQTYLALKDWLPTLGDKGIELVHLSDIVGIIDN